jgi:hypothetical protein
MSEEETTEETTEETQPEENKKPIEAATLKILDGLAKKGLDQVEDDSVRGYLTEVWGGLKDELPDLFDVIVGEGEVVLSGKHLDSTKAIMKKMQADILSLKAGEIDTVDFEEIIEIRRAAIFALYNAQRISQVQPSLQKVLTAAGRVAEILVTKGAPFILALL